MSACLCALVYQLLTVCTAYAADLLFAKARQEDDEPLIIRAKHLFKVTLVVKQEAKPVEPIPGVSNNLADYKYSVNLHQHVYSSEM